MSSVVLFEGKYSNKTHETKKVFCFFGVFTADYALNKQKCRQTEQSEPETGAEKKLIE